VTTRHLTIGMLTIAAALAGAGCGGDDKPKKPEKKAAAAGRLDDLIKDLGAEGKLAQQIGCSITAPTMLEAVHKSEDDLADTEYSSEPPSSGPHLADWGAWGFYTEPVADGHAIHHLEHGGVMLWYGKDAFTPEQLSLIRDEVLDKDEKWVVTPREDLDGFATASWGTLMSCPTESVAKLKQPEQLQSLLDTWFENVESKQTPAEAEIPAWAGAVTEPEPERDISTPSP
jgi:hypothetical protein